jgi:hypothetical protein
VQTDIILECLGEIAVGLDGIHGHMTGIVTDIQLEANRSTVSGDPIGRSFHLHKRRVSTHGFMDALNISPGESGPEMLFNLLGPLRGPIQLCGRVYRRFNPFRRRPSEVGTQFLKRLPVLGTEKPPLAALSQSSPCS